MHDLFLDEDVDRISFPHITFVEVVEGELYPSVGFVVFIELHEFFD